VKDASFSIVIPTYRRPDALRTTLSAVLGLRTPGDCELIVVDNAGDTATERVVKDVEGNRQVVHYERFTGGGAAAARNRGAELAGGRWLLFCDDDVMPVQVDHLERHLSAHLAHPRALVAGEWSFLPDLERSFEATSFGRYRLELEAGFRERVRARPIGSERVEPQFIDSNNLSVERSLFTQLGGFDPAFPYAGAEDQDLSLRAREAGCTLVLDRSIRVHHNDRRLSLREFCTREERSAQTVVVLARNFPAEAGDRALLTENRPISRGDRPALIAKKIAKGILSRKVPLAGLHRLTELVERLPIGEPFLRRFYRATIGLHIFRGVRTALTTTNES